MSLNPGTLRHKVQLQRDMVYRVNGLESKTPEVYATVWASVVFLSGSESWTNHMIDVTANIRVTMRYRSDLQPAHRILWNGRNLEIKSIIPDEERRETLIVDCKG